MNSTIRLCHMHKNLYTSGREISLFCDVSLVFEQRSSYAIMGVSGSGKTTLLSLISGLEQPTSGHILYNNQNCAALSRTKKLELLYSSYGIMLQRPLLLTECSVVENVLLKSLVRPRRTESAAIATSRAHELLSYVGLADRAHDCPSILSGGEQQRLAVACALFNKPDFIIADEPTAHVDASSKEVIISLLKKAHAQWNVGIIVATHDATVAAEMNFLCTIGGNNVHTTQKTFNDS